jgi:hypothetical protein
MSTDLESPVYVSTSDGSIYTIEAGLAKHFEALASRWTVAEDTGYDGSQIVLFSSQDEAFDLDVCDASFELWFHYTTAHFTKMGKNWKNKRDNEERSQMVYNGSVDDFNGKYLWVSEVDEELEEKYSALTYSDLKAILIDADDANLYQLGQFEDHDIPNMFFPFVATIAKRLIDGKKGHALADVMGIPHYTPRVINGKNVKVPFNFCSLEDYEYRKKLVAYISG